MRECPCKNIPCCFKNKTCIVMNIFGKIAPRSLSVIAPVLCSCVLLFLLFIVMVMHSPPRTVPISLYANLSCCGDPPCPFSFAFRVVLLLSSFRILLRS
jgi:hypothetical protein